MSEVQRIQSTPHFRPLFDDSHPDAKKMFKVLRGGRGGMKSWQIGRALLLRGNQNREKILCGREYQNSIADSVMALLQDQADRIGISSFYRFYETSVVGENKTEFLFKGFSKNIASLKSIEGVKRLWIEEAHTISQKSIDTLFPSIRQEDVEIIISYNPDLEDDPIHKFVNSLPPEHVYLAEVNAADNPWLPKSLKIQMELALRRIREATNEEERIIETEAYEQIWLGRTRKNSRAQIFAGKTSRERFEFTRHEGNWRLMVDGGVVICKIHGPFFGVDWGFSVDPLAGLRCWIVEEGGRDTLYIDHEIYKHRVELDETPDELRKIPLLDKHTVRADSARPESVAYCRRDRVKNGEPVKGLSVVSVEKWPDSVEDGIAVLKSFKKIVIHERCVNMIDEARYYSYKVDAKTGDVLPEIVDKFNHLWDALRYALAPFIKRSGKGVGFYEYAKKQAQEAKQS